MLQPTFVQSKPAMGGVMHWKSLGQRKKTMVSRTASQQNGTRLERMRRVEAALFLTREPISLRKIKQLADLSDQSETRTLVQLLNHYYDSVGRSFRVEGIAGGYMLMTRPELSSWLRRLVPKRQQIRLSSPAMETLAVVAYRQPVVRAEIDAVRGVNCGEILRQLMEIDLVRISGRSEELGRPYLYSTTGRFLKHFGLNNLDELPKTKSMLESPDVVSRDPETRQDRSLKLKSSLLDQEQEESKVKVTAAVLDFETTTADELSRKLASNPANIDLDDEDDDLDDYDDDELEDDDDDFDDDDDDEFDDEVDDEVEDEEIDEVDDEADDLDEEDEWEEVEDDIDDDEEDEEWEDDEDDWDDDEEEEEEDDDDWE